MDKVLRPNVLDIEVNRILDGKNAAQFQHWEKTMDNILVVIKDTALTDELKYQVLINFISPELFTHVSSETKYSEAVKMLKELFVKKKNLNFATHCLATRCQQDGESVEQFLIALGKLAKDFQSKQVNAAQHEQEGILSAFISGIRSPQICQRILESEKDFTETS